MNSKATNVIPLFRNNHGNGVLSGHLVLSHGIFLEHILRDNAEDEFREPIDEAVQRLKDSGCTSLCLVVTPTFLIPCDILRLLSSHYDSILSIRVLQHSTAQGKYMSLIHTRSNEAAVDIMRQFHGRPLTSLDPTVALLCGVTSTALGEESIRLPASMSREDASIVDSGEICVLCLETMEADDGNLEHTFTMCCNHSFHINCAMRLESPQCPVCRYRHDDTDEMLSCCHDCGWRGFSHGSVSLHASTGSGSVAVSHVDAAGRDIGEDSCGGEMTHRSVDNDLWLCLVCGYIGDGYVHRLLLQHSDQILEPRTVTTTTADHRISATDKLVEVSNPGLINESGVRPAMAGLSSGQEELAVHRKLEAVAAQYSNIMTIQLTRQRQMYETQLRLLDDKFSRPADLVGAEQMSGALAGCSSEWTLRVISSLRAERQRLIQQCDNMNQRLNKSEKEASVLEALNQALLRNQSEWQAVVVGAEAALCDVELALRTELPPLERKVRELMIQLEQEGAPEEIDSAVSKA